MFLWRTLNNDALKLLSERQFEEAIIKFRYSLALISEKNFKSSILELGSSESDSLKLLPCPVPVQLDSQVFCNCHELSPDNLFNVYEKGFEFQDCTMHPPQHYILLTMDPLLLSTIARSIVMYNLALAFHGQALATETGSSLYLQQSLHLYQMSSVSLFHAVGQLRDDDEFLFLVSLALLSNMGHLMSHFWIHQGAMDCLCSIKNYRHVDLFDSLSRNDTKFFNQTVVFGRVACTRFLVAPAA